VRAIPILISTSLSAIKGAAGSGGAVEAIPRTRRCDELGGVHTVFITHGNPPARCFPGVVAPLTVPNPLPDTGRPTPVTQASDKSHAPAGHNVDKVTDEPSHLPACDSSQWN